VYNTKFILIDYQEIYPGYLDKENREAIKIQFNNKSEFMWCGCRSDIKLYYRISEDLKIYPEHNNYDHDRCCCRYKTAFGKTERHTAYVINDEDGQVTTYLTFDLKDFDLSKDLEKEQNNPEIIDDENAEDEAVLEKDEEVPLNKEERKEPKLSLPSLIRSINVDTFTEKVLNNRKIDSRETFSKYVYHRMKKVKVSRMKKSIGELTLETDGVKFIYVPFAGIVKRNDKGLEKCYLQNIGTDGKIFNNFIFPDSLEKAIKEFVKMYGMEPNENTIISGFQYYKKTRSKVQYKILGRVHLFQTSSIGIYCNNLLEKETYDTLYKIIEQDKGLKFWIPADDDSIGGIIQIENKKKKVLLLYRSKKHERISFDSSIYEPLVVGVNEPLTKERLYELIENL
jgi:hypothetical protein